MSSPDWTIDYSTMPLGLSQEQRELLDEIERTLLSFGQRPADPQLAIAAVAPLVTALAATGLAAEQIADNSRIRPAAVKEILSR
ncbi:hypothetical protein QWJ90_12590 [Microbacterium oryzae]|uniref:hypothetical protein n=1 Tax=Microbacterium oryzae TaxID=743009 RepID=UPI0025B0DDD0|nr:hypothetical protein [Microbacterium oryzae]MDN3311767.1 hypothetical protein [Microbacterium oryzae]